MQGDLPLFLPSSSLIDPDGLFNRPHNRLVEHVLTNMFNEGRWDQMLPEVGLIDHFGHLSHDGINRPLIRRLANHLHGSWSGWQRKQVEESDRVLALGTAICTVAFKDTVLFCQCFKHWIGTIAAQGHWKPFAIAMQGEVVDEHTHLECCLPLVFSSLGESRPAMLIADRFPGIDQTDPILQVAVHLQGRLESLSNDNEG